MKAEEARSIAAGEHKKRMEPIYSQIKKEAENQKLELFYYKSMYSAEIQELKDNGFDVETIFDRNETFYRISWKQ